MDKAFFTILAAVLLGATIMPRPLKAQDNAGGNEVKNNDKANIGDSEYILSSAKNNLASPLKKLLITSHFGARYHPFLKIWLGHNGIDLEAKSDTVFMIFDGTIIRVGYDGRSGIYISAISGDIEVSFCHLSMIFVLPGDRILAGQPLGVTGTTGMSTGEHLHLGVKYKGEYVNPLPLVKYLSGQ